MRREEILKKIMQKKEFSQLPKKDVELAFSRFDTEEYSDLEKIKLTRELLMKVYSAFLSKKLLMVKDRDSEWILKKHISTRERFQHYEKLYSLILEGISGKINIFDFGAGMNGFSYEYFNQKVYYLGIEAIGQLVSSMNRFFERNKLEDYARAEHLSLFELEEIRKVIKRTKGKKIVLLFKILDSLEMLKRDYSKTLLMEIGGLVDRIVVSFATKTIYKRRNFKAQRNWLISFISKNFTVIENFELGDERYIIFKGKDL